MDLNSVLYVSEMCMLSHQKHLSWIQHRLPGAFSWGTASKHPSVVKVNHNTYSSASLTMRVFMYARPFALFDCPLYSMRLFTLCHGLCSLSLAFFLCSLSTASFLCFLSIAFTPLLYLFCLLPSIFFHALRVFAPSHVCVSLFGWLCFCFPSVFFLVLPSCCILYDTLFSLMASLC